MRYAQTIKPLLDFSGACILLILSMPCSIPVCVVNSFLYRGKPLFIQQRTGKHEKLFRVYKFRTMRNACDSRGDLLPDADRITRFGSWLRKTSLDEIPQLINILLGQMSFVGPRPLLVKYLPYYSARERLRHSVKPGITGLAQVAGRNALGWDARLQLDCRYVESVSLALDLRILWKTIGKVFRAEDLYVDPRSIMRDLDVERKAQAHN